ncbi:RNA methyltransferase [Psychrobacter sp.]|uniref:RNA methyltransferase n=1 Tax=Psychrobacter sp. TaxID=56811 RepID=UPI0025FD1D6D|nr:RNA methyltransferase [Psychrobacter sp.]
MTHPTTENQDKDQDQNQDQNQVHNQVNNQVKNHAPLNKSDDNASRLPLLLGSIRIIMVNTTLPANIGSAARAMLTMGLKDLVVVNPKHPIDEKSIAHAAGAQNVLANCRIVESLEEAISDCQLVFAASSRQRHIPRPVINPTEAAKIISARPITQTKVAVLFGREDRGLTNQELSMADYHIQIDANPEYPVLNVASAIQVISSFFYSHFLQQVSADYSIKTQNDYLEQNQVTLTQRQIWDMPAISQHQKSQLQTRIIELMNRLQLVESTEADKLRDLPSRLSRLLSRLQLDEKEYEIVSSIIAKIKRKL